MRLIPPYSLPIKNALLSQTSALWSKEGMTHFLIPFRGALIKAFRREIGFIPSPRQAVGVPVSGGKREGTQYDL